MKRDSITEPAVRDPPLLPGDPGNPAAAAVIPPPVDKNVDLDGDGALSLAEVQYAAFVHHGLSSSVVEGLFNEVSIPFTCVALSMAV